MIMYTLNNRTDDSTKLVLLESEQEKHHLLHWTDTGSTVTFKAFEKYDSGGPQIDLEDKDDQKYVWVIPCKKNARSLFSLQPYNQSDCYLTEKDTNNEATTKRGPDETDFILH